MSRRLRAAGALAGWLGFLLAMVATLHAVGGPLAPPPISGVDGARAWMDERQSVDVVFAVLRLAALGLGWYLLVVTVLSLLARCLRLAALITVVDALTVPGVRRLVNSAVGVSLVATGYPGVAAAQSPPPAESPPPAVETMRRLPDAAPVTMRRLPEEPPGPPPTRPTPTTTSPPPTKPAPTPPPAPRPAGASWPVRPGDHFWAVAERALAEGWGRAPTDAEVAPYWRRLVEANQAKLADPANPDLLFPGQMLTVPPVPARPG